MSVLETKARRLWKAPFFWTLFRFLRKKNHRHTNAPTIATSPIPPSTPPAISPALDFELTADVVELGVGANLNTVLDDDREFEILVLVVTAEEVVDVSLATTSAAIMLKLLLVRVKLI